ncbi:DUF418 domain-containing protein [Maribacter sp. HTCC2170]|uniref:DUF418 domain-containing protein n=1 Tax=Maribacter sp. (strain HTCC2170 / KCCM 42371) TaxID=313603 RepID=UPI00006AFD67|nr:DUF418 domain-containing protein [Maribacter sp. HTCC2170]EAR01372.1 putative transport protein [Maribacter sp. HTCC2170]
MAETKKKERIEIIDALRGFSLAGIVIVHFVENFIGSAVPQDVLEGLHIGPLDYVVDVFIGLFLRGKFFALFSFLFGLSFFIQMDNAQQNGRTFGARFLWRLIILLVIGAVHHMFYRGDILTIYALLGILLIPFYKLDNKWILALTALLFLGVGRFLIFGITGGEYMFSQGGLMPDEPETRAYFNTIKNGSFLEVFESNSTSGHLNKLEFQLGYFGRGYITFAFFLLGLLAGRIGFFKTLNEHKTLLKKILIGSIILFVVSIALTALIFMQMGENPSFSTWPAMLGLTAYDLNNIAMTFILIVLFIMLYKKVKGEKMLRIFAPYGRMALSNYFFQSLLGTFIFFGWGMGYLVELRNGYTFLIALAVIVLQMFISKWWLRKFHYGPLEWVWRSLTFFKIFPMKKEKAQ